MPILIDNLNKSYDKPILKDIHLTLDATKITVLLGKSGCGKTTLLRLIAGLAQPDTGSIKHDCSISVVFQEPRLFPWLTVKNNIRCYRKNEDVDHYQKILDAIQLKGYEDYYPSQLSGGMKQRVAIGRALYSSPNYLLMDEPFSALDYFTRKQLQKEILTLCQQFQIGVLFVTHNIEEAITLADRILILKEGKMVKDLDLSTNKPSHDSAHLSQTILHAIEEEQ